MKAIYFIQDIASAAGKHLNVTDVKVDMNLDLKTSPDPKYCLFIWIYFLTETGKSKTIYHCPTISEHCQFNPVITINHIEMEAMAIAGPKSGLEL